VTSVGLNYRMSEMQAALGRTQTARLGEILSRRKANFAALSRGLSGIDGVRWLDSQTPDCQSSHYCLSMVLSDKLGPMRTDIVAKLNARGVGTSVYYPQPVPRMQFYRQKYGHDMKRFPNAAKISDHSIALPVGQHLDTEDMAYIAQAVKSVLTEVAR
jgi:dTDP-4-amino-4,6-dideoxygalactose transaminase